MGSPIKGYRVRGLTGLSVVCGAGLVPAACEDSGFEPGTPQTDANPIWEPGEDRSGSIFGSQGLLLFGVEDDKGPSDGGGWRDAPVAAKTDTRIEDAILTKARQLRLETLKQ